MILERLFDILTLLIVNRDENAALQFRAEFFKCPRLAGQLRPNQQLVL